MCLQIKSTLPWKEQTTRRTNKLVDDCADGGVRCSGRVRNSKSGAISYPNLNPNPSPSGDFKLNCPLLIIVCMFYVQMTFIADRLLL